MEPDLSSTVKGLELSANVKESPAAAETLNANTDQELSGNVTGSHVETQNVARGNEQPSSQIIDTSAPRNDAKWWYSTFHNVTAMVGAGVLGLPYAISQLGWAAGVIAILVSWLVTFYTLWLLVEMHEMFPGERFGRYYELGKHVFGKKWGTWVVMLQQLTVQISSTIVYCVTGGKSLKKFCDMLDIPLLSHNRQTYFILFFVVIQLLLSQIPNFNRLKIISLLAALMSVCYSVVAFSASTVKGVQHHPTDYGVRSDDVAGRIFDVFNALGTIAFAFAGHSVVLEIQATLPSTPEKPSKVPMWRGVVVAYIIVIACYLSVAISGFWAFGSTVEDDVLLSLERPPWIIAVANLMVFIHVIGSFQVFAMPIFDTIEVHLRRRLAIKTSNNLRFLGDTSNLPFIVRSLYVATVGFVAICVPFFGGLLGFFGGLAFTSTSFIIPCALWLKATRTKPFSFHRIVAPACLIIGSIILLVAPIGGLRTIIVSAKTYKMFS